MWSSCSKQSCQQGVTKFTGQEFRKEPPRTRIVTRPSVSEGLVLRKELYFMFIKQLRVRREGEWVKLFRERFGKRYIRITGLCGET